MLYTGNKSNMVIQLYLNLKKIKNRGGLKKWHIPLPVSSQLNELSKMFFQIYIFLLQLIYDVLSISDEQQSDPVIYRYIIFSQIILHHVPSQVTRYSLLCYRVVSYCLFTLNAIVFVYKLQTPSPSHTTPLCFGNHKSVLQVLEFVSFLQIHSFVPYIRFQICDIIWYLSFSF